MHELNGIGNQEAFRTLVRKRNLCAYGTGFFFIEAKSTERKPQIVYGRFDGLINEELSLSLCMMYRVRCCFGQIRTPTKANTYFVCTRFRQHGLPGYLVGALVFCSGQIILPFMVGAYIGFSPGTHVLSFGIIDHNTFNFTIQPQFAKGILVIDFQAIKG